MIPDYCEALTGYRAWNVASHGLLASSTGYAWLPRKAKAAKCLQHENTRMHWHPETGELMAAPVLGCSCGYYAYKIAVGPQHTPLEVHGEVKLWGRIIEHEDGYRAQFAYPSRLRCADPRLAARLRFLYGVPCEVDAQLSQGVQSQLSSLAFSQIQQHTQQQQMIVTSGGLLSAFTLPATPPSRIIPRGSLRRLGRWIVTNSKAPKPPRYT